ncbi:MAG: hypothetical protein HY855_01755 [Burkholderiales bacterium]|nr:hypothetical protein [Burkholderiales bacterium]
MTRTEHPGPGPEPLSAALGRLAEDLATVAPPPLPAAARRALARPASPWRRGLAWAASGAALCGAALAASLVLMVLAPPDGPPGAQFPVQAGEAFVNVASAERWQQLMRGDSAAAAWLVPTELPRERLAALGLPVDPSRVGERVPAELLMHPSGEVLAVRVLHP